MLPLPFAADVDAAPLRDDHAERNRSREERRRDHERAASRSKLPSSGGAAHQRRTCSSADVRGSPAGSVSMNVAAVRSRHDPRVEDRDDAAVVAAADQPAEPLLERDRRGGQLDGLKRIAIRLRRTPACAPRPADRCAARTGACRSRPGSARRPARRRPPRTSRCRAGPRRASTRNRSISVARGASPWTSRGYGSAGESGGRIAQRAVRREQQERAALRDREQLERALRRRSAENASSAGGGQIARHVEHRLARVVERRRHQQLVAASARRGRAARADSAKSPAAASVADVKIGVGPR